MLTWTFVREHFNLAIIYIHLDWQALEVFKNDRIISFPMQYILKLLCKKHRMVFFYHKFDLVIFDFKWLVILNIGRSWTWDVPRKRQTPYPLVQRSGFEWLIWYHKCSFLWMHCTCSLKGKTLRGFFIMCFVFYVNSQYVKLIERFIV